MKELEKRFIVLKNHKSRSVVSEGDDLMMTEQFCIDATSIKVGIMASIYRAFGVVEQASDFHKPGYHHVSSVMRFSCFFNKLKHPQQRPFSAQNEGSSCPSTISEANATITN